MMLNYFDFDTLNNDSKRVYIAHLKLLRVVYKYFGTLSV